MVMYQFYNVDLLDIPGKDGESAIAYVDDTLLLATAHNFHDTHSKLKDMMTREGGVDEWSLAHNSPLEYSKLALIDFAHRNSRKEHQETCHLLFCTRTSSCELMRARTSEKVDKSTSNLESKKS